MNSKSRDELRKENDQLRWQLEQYKQVEEALKDSEERYRLLAENVTDIIWTMDMNFRYTYLSPSSEHQSGYTHEEAMAMTLEETFTPASVEVIQKAFSEELALERSGGRDRSVSRTLELEACNKDGSTTWVEVVASFLRDAEGQPVGILGITRNIADRKRAEEALRESEARFRGIYEDSPIAIELLDSDGRLVSVNKACLDMFGQRDDTKLKWFKLLEDPYLPEDVRQKVRTGQIARYETRWDFDEVKRLKLYETTRSGVAHLDVMVSPLGLSEGEPLRGYLVQIQDVTERRRAEEALRESEEKYRLLAENVTDLIYVMDMDMKVTYINPSITPLLGFSVEEGMARGLTESLTPASLGLAAKALQSVVPAGKVQPGGFQDRGTVELEMYRKDGSTMWAESLVTVMRDSDGRPVGILGVTRDITERKRAEEALRESEAKYAAVAEQAADGIVVVQDRIIKFVNNGHAQITGYSVEELIGMPFLDTVDSSIRDLVIQRYATRMAGTPIPVAFETRILCKDGTVKEAEARSTTIQYQGRPAVLSIVRDVTERKKAQEALWQSEQRLQLIFDSVAEGIAVVDLQGAITEANQGLADIHRFRSKGQMIGKGMVDLLDPRDNEKAMISIRKIIKEGADRNVEYTLVRTDGSRFPGEINTSLLKDAGNNPIGFISSTRDITERKQAEQKLREAFESERKLRQELETEMKKRVEFTRALVNELKTPLTSVIASSELLALELPEGPLLRMARNINRSADTLNKRIDELLDVARGELGMLKLSLASVDPSRLLRELAADMGPVALSQHRSLLLDLPPALPLVWADEDRLRQVVLNLLSNACKFTDERGKITLKAREEGDSLIVEVEDTGPGLSEEDQQRLFLPYHRLMGDRERLSGLGLGLALCKTLVELHGGKIWVRSQPGKGSTFGFSVPLATASQQREAAEAQEE